MDAKDLARCIYENISNGEWLYRDAMYDRLKADIMSLIIEIEYEFKENTK